MPEVLVLHSALSSPRLLSIPSSPSVAPVVRPLFQRSHRIEKWGRSIKMILEREHFALKFFPEGCFGNP